MAKENKEYDLSIEGDFLEATRRKLNSIVRQAIHEMLTKHEEQAIVNLKITFANDENGFTVKDKCTYKIPVEGKSEVDEYIFQELCALPNGKVGRLVDQPQRSMFDSDMPEVE